ncbi:hypothetical protein HHL28_04190 [Aerophototrophica crusticola]|uniref:Uncharacterized protein n=1 Tax=Aerophototrophica crusticola TaxID=1709002 RepID=A0A858R4T7_9PROT|nr:hypothetical protein HHL28_04190 [Rhodospirillaceae bacterium B3]
MTSIDNRTNIGAGSNSPPSPQDKANLAGAGGNDQLLRRFAELAKQSAAAASAFVDSLSEDEQNTKVWTNLGEKVGLHTLGEVRDYNNIRTAMGDRLQAMADQSGTKDRRAFMKLPAVEEWVAVMDDFQKHKPGGSERALAYLARQNQPNDKITLSAEAGRLFKSDMAAGKTQASVEDLAVQLLGGTPRKPGGGLDKLV